MAADDMLRVLLATSVPSRTGGSGAGDVPEGHDRDGEELGRLARRLRDAGHEVVLLGRVASRPHLEAVAVQEDVDATLVWNGSEFEVEAEETGVESSLSALLGM